VSLPPPSSQGTAIVTGASAGIGADLARELSQRGYGVTLVARRLNELNALAEELDTRVEVIACDLAVPDQRIELLREVARRGLQVDILVNNAGLGTMGPIAATDVDRELQMVRVNVEAVIDLCTRVVPAMVARRAGAILNVSSTAAFTPMPGQAGYAATKAFVQSYTDALRAEVARYDVTVTSLCPGPVRTEFVGAAGASDELFSKVVPEFMWETPELVAKAGIDALAVGRRVVMPGVANRLLSHAEQHLPRSVVVPLIARATPLLRLKRG
jgi:short-subunit dehydrogenase